MSYVVKDRDIHLIRQAAHLIGAEAKALFECHTTTSGEWSDDAAAEEDYQTMRTLQVRLDDLARRMKA